VNFDPFDINRKLFSEWEKKLAEFMDKRMRDPDFMSLVGKGISTSMDAKSAFDARMDEWFKSLNLPTRHDLERVWTTLNNLETRVIDIEDRLEALESGQRAAAPELPAPKAKKTKKVSK
jgi:BMFP domain-containing protein YqiC